MFPVLSGVHPGVELLGHVVSLCKEWPPANAVIGQQTITSSKHFRFSDNQATIRLTALNSTVITLLRHPIGRIICRVVFSICGHKQMYYYHCCNILAQTWWLQTTHVYYLTALEARSLKWVKMSPGLHSLLGDAGQSLFSCSFQLLEATYVPQNTVPFHLQG